MPESSHILINGSNSRNIAGRDINNIQAPRPSWIEQRKIIDEVIQHFKLFFHLANQIKDKKCGNSFSDCRSRMNREFVITRISVLDENHQKEIYDMHHKLISLRTINEYTHVLQDTYLERLQQFSSHYRS